MAKQNALQRVESHEKLCRIMQKLTHKKIHSIEERVKRLEKILLTCSGALISPDPGVLSIPLRVAVILLVISFKEKCFDSCIIL